jgi:O-antigen ligase
VIRRGNEVAGLLRINRRRLSMILVVAFLVGAPTAGLLATRPTHYTATATVNLFAQVHSTANDDEQTRVANDFASAVTTSGVDASAARAAGATTAAISSGVAATVPSNGFLATVTYSSTNPDLASTVVRTVAQRALELLDQQDVATAQATNVSGQQVSLDLRTAPAPARQSTNVLALVPQLPPTLLGQTSSVTVLDAALQTLALNGGSVAPADPVLAGDLANFKKAMSEVQQTSGQLMVAEARLSGGAAPSFVLVGQPQAIGPARAAATDGFVAGALAALVAVGVLAGTEFRRGATVPEPTRSDRGTVSGSLGRHGRRRAAPMIVLSNSLADSETGTLLILLGIALLSLLVALGVTDLLGNGSKKTLAVAAALPLGVAAAMIALYRFELFLLSVIVLRTALDTLNVTSNAGGGLDPGAALGAVFIVAGALWLLTQRRTGHWVRTSAPVWWLWAFAVACLLSAAGAADPFVSIQATAKVAAGTLMFQVLEQYLGRRPERVRAVLTSLFLSSILPVAMAGYQWVRGEGNTLDVSVSRVSGSFPHPSSLANYLLFLLPLCILLIGHLRGRMRYTMVAVTAVYGGIVLLTYTRAAWVAVVIFALYLGARSRRELLVGTVVALVIVTIAVPSVTSRFTDLKSTPVTSVSQTDPPNSLSWRIGYWEHLVPLAAQDLVNGIGFDMVETTQPEHLEPHDGFVQAYVETGILGLITILGVMTSLCVYLRRRVQLSRTPWERLLALAGVGAGIGLFFQFPVENLLDQTFVYWYFAAAVTFGYPMTQRTDTGDWPDLGGNDDASLLGSADSLVRT